MMDNIIECIIRAGCFVESTFWQMRLANRALCIYTINRTRALGLGLGVSSERAALILTWLLWKKVSWYNQ